MLERILSHDPRREALDHRAEAGRTKAFVKFAPADDSVCRCDLEKMVVSPPRVAGQQLDASHLRVLRHGVSLLLFMIRSLNEGRAAIPPPAMTAGASYQRHQPRSPRSSCAPSTALHAPAMAVPGAWWRDCPTSRRPPCPIGSGSSG